MCRDGTPACSKMFSQICQAKQVSSTEKSAQTELNFSERSYSLVVRCSVHFSADARPLELWVDDRKPATPGHLTPCSALRGQLSIQPQRLKRSRLIVPEICLNSLVSDEERRSYFSPLRKLALGAVRRC